MKPVTLQQVAEFCGGTLHGDGHTLVTTVTTDSRTAGAGQVFVALVGDKFDGHSFISQVAGAGAAAVIVSKLPSPLPANCAVIEVADTLIALQQLAKNYRLWHNPLVVGVTGSNGKTSTKDFLAVMLARRYQICATLGNLNNHIGLPLTLLRLAEGDTCALVEMGMNHAGELAVLCDIAKPDAGVVTNVGIAHIENLGSREAIAEEKGTLPAAVHAGGIAVLNAQDDFTPVIRARCAATVITAGIGCGDVQAHIRSSSAAGTEFDLTFPDQTKVSTLLPVPGEHMVLNAALAAACAWKHGVTPPQIAEVLSAVKITKGRLEMKSIGGITFLDDSYNANPDSMKAGLRTLAGLECKGRRFAVLGRMGELGEHATTGHREVGDYAAGLGIDVVFSVGDAEAALISEAAGSRGRHFTTHADCAAALRDHAHEGDLVLIKGSRSAAMEKILTHFQTS